MAGARGTGLLCGAMLVAMATAAHAQGWSTDTWGSVRANVYTPQSQSPIGEGRSLLIVLHGCSQSPDALRDQGSWGSAEEYGAVIALPFVPNGGVVAQCWDYYDGFHTREGKHTGPLLGMIDALLADDTQNIDPAQVYVSGLSSGATQSLLLGCLAPDVIAGVSSMAGPAPGTSINQIVTPTGTPESVANTCRTFAGAYAEHFDTQLASIAYGTSDGVVAQGYGPINAGAFGVLYADGGAALQQGQFDVASLPGEGAAGNGTVWSDAEGPRVTLLELSGANHAWPAGNGMGGFGGFVEGRGVDYAAYLLQLFTENNRRVGGGEVRPPQGPAIASVSAQITADGVRVEGRATPVGRVATVEVTLDGPGGGQQQTSPDGAGAFSVTFTDLSEGATYTPGAVAIDVDGQRSASRQGASVTLSTAEANQPPEITIESEQAIAGCARISGVVRDDVEGATVQMTLITDMRAEVGTAQAAVTSDGFWEVELCELGVGCYQGILEATDAGGLTAEAYGGVLALGEGGIVDEAEATLWGHIPRMTREGFSYRVADATYAELEEMYGAFEPFTLYQGADGQWYAYPENVPGGEIPDCGDFDIAEPPPPPPPPMGGATGGAGGGVVGMGGDGGAGGAGGEGPSGGTGAGPVPFPMGGITGEVDGPDGGVGQDGPNVRSSDDGCSTSNTGGSLLCLLMLLGLLRRRDL